MKKLYAIALTAVLALVLLPNAGSAQQMNLEKITNTRIFVLAVCDTLHAETGDSTCSNFHVDKIKKSTDVGREIVLNGKSYVIDWIGAAYYTASGRVLQATGDGSQGTLGLLEIRPNLGSLHQAAWQDVDQDGELSVSDMVTIDGRNEPVVDKRLNVRVEPAN